MTPKRIFLSVGPPRSAHVPLSVVSEQTTKMVLCSGAVSRCGNVQATQQQRSRKLWKHLRNTLAQRADESKHLNVTATQQHTWPHTDNAMSIAPTPRAVRDTPAGAMNTHAMRASTTDAANAKMHARLDIAALLKRTRVANIAYARTGTSHKPGIVRLRLRQPCMLHQVPSATCQRSVNRVSTQCPQSVN